MKMKWLVFYPTILYWKVILGREQPELIMGVWCESCPWCRIDQPLDKQSYHCDTEYASTNGKQYHPGMHCRHFVFQNDAHAQLVVMHILYSVDVTLFMDGDLTVLFLFSVSLKAPVMARCTLGYTLIRCWIETRSPVPGVRCDKSFVKHCRK